MVVVVLVLVVLVVVLRDIVMINVVIHAGTHSEVLNLIAVIVVLLLLVVVWGEKGARGEEWAAMWRKGRRRARLGEGNRSRRG